MKRHAHISVWVHKTNQGKEGIEVLRSGVKADADYVEWMREAFERSGVELVTNLLDRVEVDGRVHMVEFDLIATRPRQMPWKRAMFDVENVTVYRGETLDDWVRKNVVEAAEWW